MYFTPLLCARSILSENGKNASEPSVTSAILSSHALFSSLVNTSGFSLKIFSHAPSASTSIYSSPIYTSIALSLSARRIPSINGRFITFGHCLSHQLSAFWPARRVQCTRDCCPAPIPIACPSFTKHTELDCVYFNVIREIFRSLSAFSGISLFSVTILESSASSIGSSCLPCSNVTPYTSLCSRGAG